MCLFQRDTKHIVAVWNRGHRMGFPLPFPTPRLDPGGRGPPGGGGDGVYTNNHICPLTPPQSCWLLRLRSMVLLHRCFGGLKKKCLLRSSLWSGMENMPCAHVMWDDRILLKKVGELSLTLPEDAMSALMSKWGIQALLPSQSNLLLILNYHIL